MRVNVLSGFCCTIQLILSQSIQLYVVLQRLTPRFWWHNPLHIGIFSDAQANDIDNALTVATMGTGQEPSERGIGAGPWLLERSPHLQRLASHARFMVSFVSFS